MFPDLVEQKSTTTGTGAYVMGEAVTGKRTFLGAYPADAANLPYFATDDIGGWEAGLGAWTAATQSLARTKVTASSNGGAAVNWAAGTRRVYLTPHGGALGFVAGRHNLNPANSVAPGNADDSTQGYAIGSLYLATISGAVRLFVCADATAAAAQWGELPLFSSGGQLVLQDPLTGVRRIVSVGLDTLGSYTQQGGGFVLNGADAAWANGYWADGCVGLTLSAKTTDATPTKLGAGGSFSHWEALQFSDTTPTVAFEAIVTATTLDGTNRKTWKVQGVASCDSAGAVTVHLSSATVLYETAPAGATAAWAIAVVAGGTYAVTLQGTGAAATTIAWGAVITGAAAVGAA